MMMYPIRLKTGFFETSAYTLSIRYEGVILTSADGNHETRISRDDISAVTITMKRYPRFEMQISEKTFSGTFSDEIEYGELERQLRESFGSRIIIETE